jgi:hypothetical protein
MAAVLGARPAVASHLSAAYLWELLRYRPETITVTTPTHRRAGRGFGIHCASLAPADRDERDGIPVTSVARTILDLAATAPRRLERILERAEELHLFDLAALDELLARATRHRGTGVLRDALCTYREDPAFTRSGLERRFLELVRSASLPLPAMNYNVAGFELDAYWETERFAVELDVFETHGTRAAFERDRSRDEELKLAGVELLRITGPRLDREPEVVVERLRVLLARRRRERGVRPRGGDARGSS